MHREQEIANRLNVHYYAVMILTLLSYGAGYYLRLKQYITPLDPLSQAGTAIQYILYMDLLITLPGGLYWFKQQCRKMALLDEAERYARYTRAATLRIWLVSHSMILSVFLFWWLGANQPTGTYRPMIWLAAMAAIGWYFTKPLPAKIEKELQPFVNDSGYPVDFNGSKNETKDL